jgi:hypothetical protein
MIILLPAQKCLEAGCALHVQGTLPPVSVSARNALFFGLLAVNDWPFTGSVANRGYRMASDTCAVCDISTHCAKLYTDLNLCAAPASAGSLDGNCRGYR